MQVEQTISALLPKELMMSNGSVTRNLNYDVPAESRTWPEHENNIFRAIQYFGGDRLAAIRDYRRNPAKYLHRRFCADVTGGDFHFLPEDARASQTFCNASCRSALVSAA
jgi:hypothetical protein